MTRHFWRWFAAAVSIGVLVFVLTRANDEPEKSDFWSVAVPGALTGFGTLALAGATVWLSVSERKRDDRLRREQRQQLGREREHDRKVLNEQRDAELEVQARQEAFCVVAICDSRPPLDFVSNPDADDTAQVTVVNGSSAPILNVRLDRAIATGTARYGTLTFRPEDENHVAFDHDQWLSPIVLAGKETSVDGAWVRDQGQERIRADEVQFIIGEQVDAVVTWTDARGFKWKRVGYDDPDRMT